MNYNLGNALKSKNNSLHNELDNSNDDDDDEVDGGSSRVRTMRGKVDGEEESNGQGLIFNEDGESMEPFHLQNEREDGHFDESGNFVFRKQQREDDAWLAGLDEAEIEKSIGDVAEAMRRKALRAQQAEKPSHESPEELRMELLTFLIRGESVAMAMRRLGGVKSTLPNKRPVKTASADSTTALAQSVSKAQLARLTEITSQLLDDGDTSIFDRTYSQLEVNVDKRDWEYRGLDGVIHGPFSTSMMAEWMKNGYFCGASAVVVRRVEAKEGSYAIPGTKRRAEEDDRDVKRCKVEADLADLADLNDDDEGSGSGGTGTGGMGGTGSGGSGGIGTIDNHLPSTHAGSSEAGPAGQPDAPWILSDNIDFLCYEPSIGGRDGFSGLTAERQLGLVGSDGSESEGSDIDDDGHSSDGV